MNERRRRVQGVKGRHRKGSVALRKSNVCLPFCCLFVSLILIARGEQGGSGKPPDFYSNEDEQVNI